MRLIIDNNILFSLMKPDSTSSHLFSIMKLEFLAPEFIKQEFKKYENECFLKSKLSKSEFLKRKKEILDKIKFIQFSEYKQFLEKAKTYVSDIDDSAYLALALKLECSIWSNDKGLKEQKKIKILSTRDIIEIFF